MTRLTEIKDQLLEARKETQAELNQIDKALDAIGIQREQPQARSRKKRNMDVRPTSQENIDRIMRIIQTSSQPLTSRQIAERADVPRERAGKALSWLEQQGEIRKEGFTTAAGGKGRALLYVSSKREMMEDIKPSPVHRIEDQARPVVPHQNQ